MADQTTWERPAAVNPYLWTAFLRARNAAPADRRTVNLPMTNDDVENAIIAMARPRTPPPAPPAPSTVGGGGSRPELFRADEPPAWTDAEKYADYYDRLRFFMHGVYVSDDRCTQACFLILARWESPSLVSYARQQDASTLARANWALTRTRILEWMDEQFRPKTDFSKEVAQWDGFAQRLARRHFKNANEFYTEFETGLFQYNAACDRAGQDRPSAREVTTKFVAALPKAVAARVRENHNDLDSRPYTTYKVQIAFVWESNLVTGMKVYLAKRSRDEAWDSEEEERAMPAFKKKVVRGRCVKGWDAAPPELQGPIRYGTWMSPEEARVTEARYNRVKRAGVCSKCRLPRKQHPLEDTYEPMPVWEGPRGGVRMAIEEAENQIEEAAED